MSRLFTPLIQLFDASGATAGSGTITFYAQGTETLQATYQNAARTLANENPLTVDGSGLSPAIYLQYLNYTVLAHDSDGVLLWQKDFDGRWLADGSDYTQGGTGSVARTVQSRLEDGVSVFDYIAIAQQAAIIAGSSSYNATADIQAAHDANVDLYWPEGTYLLVGFIATQFTRWRGAGIGKTVIKQKDGTASMATFLSGSDIEGIEFDGDEKNALGSSLAIVELGGTTTHFYKNKVTNVSRFGVRMRDYTFCSIRDNYFSEALAHGGSIGENQLFIYNVGGLTTDKSVFIVDGNFFDDTINATPEEGPAGLFVSQSSASARCIVTNNKFNNMGTNIAGNLSAAIDLYIDALSSVVSRNIVENYIFEAIKLGGAGEIICTSNQVISYVDNTQSNAIAISPHSNTSTTHRGHVVCSNNIVLQAAESGIIVLGNPSLGDVFEVVIANNVIADSGTGTGDAAIQVSEVGNWSIIGNVIRNAGLYGIRTRLSAGACAIANNNISDCVDNAIRTTDEDTIASLTCTGNICNENTTGASVIQVNIQKFKHLHFADNTVINTTTSQTGVNISGISLRLFIGDNLIDLNSGTEWTVNTSALSSTADFWTVASYPYTFSGDPGGSVTAAFAGQTIKNTSSGRIYLARTAGGTVWDIV